MLSLILIVVAIFLGLVIWANSNTTEKSSQQKNPENPEYYEIGYTNKQNISSLKIIKPLSAEYTKNGDIRFRAESEYGEIKTFLVSGISSMVLNGRYIDHDIYFAKLAESKGYSHPEKKTGNYINNSISNYVVIDIETTGLDPSNDEIIELGAVKVVDDVIVDTFSALCKPRKEIPQKITDINGITNEMVSNAKSASDILPDFIAFIGDLDIIAHNAKFDLAFIYDNYYKISNKPFNNNYVDTLRLSQELLPEMTGHRLVDLIEKFEIQTTALHRAIDDSKSVHFCYQKMKMYKLEKAIKEEEWSKRIHYLENIMGDDLETYVKESRKRFGSEMYLGLLEGMLIKKYKRIAIDSYKQQKYQDVIDICQKAISESIPGDWENRISRAEKKLNIGG
jgi:DNA polymerase III epsilon subunit family exonuclease